MVMRNISFLPGTGRGTVRRTVEGHARRTGLNDVANHSGYVLEHMTGRNPHHLHSLASKPRVSRSIAFGTIASVMRKSIEFDRNANLGAKEIQHVATCGMLSPKFEATGSLAQFAPQQAFGQRQFTAQSSRAFDSLSRSGEHSALPSTMLRMVPLPVPGRNDGGTGGYI